MNEKDRALQIAIDGPAGAGKSTIAKAVAARLGITYLDTGAMYRAVGLKALRQGISTQDEEAVGRLVEETFVEVQWSQGTQRVMLDGEDVTGQIRTAEVSRAASDVSRWLRVRQRMMRLQQQFAGTKPAVLDGRDIGTHVLPHAQFKFFVTASVEVRARRRQLEIEQRGIVQPLEETIRDIAERDHQDSTRAASPLRVAEDAEVVDTSELTVDQAVDLILSRVTGGNEHK
jgi:cytidylate kinase